TARACSMKHSACDCYRLAPSSPFSPPKSWACSSTSADRLGAVAVAAVPLSVAASLLVTSSISTLASISPVKMGTPLAPPAQFPAGNTVHRSDHFRFRLGWPATYIIPTQKQLPGDERVYAVAQQVARKPCHRVVAL